MNISRREFLKDAAFFGLGGWRLFAAPSDWKPPHNPNLVFGVVSDTHFRANKKGGFAGDSPRKYLDAALEYFRRQNVDAVVHLGDMAHNGQVEAMQLHADAWRKAFPGDRASDGRMVARLFVTGNHDVEGFTYSNYIDKIIPYKEEQEAHLLITDMAGNWECIWGEKYEPVWHKEVKGYHFYGRNWDVPENDFAAFVKEDSAQRALAECKAPVFLLSHRRLFYEFRKAVSPFCNAVAFFGHCHYSAANWNIIYTDEAKCKTFPSVQCPSCHAVGQGAALVDDAYIVKSPIAYRREAVGEARQGFVVRVYDDILTIERREFSDGVSSLGPDWVMPLGLYDPHPFSKGELKKVIGEPQFPKGAKPEVENVANVEILPNANIQSQLETGNIGIGNTGNIGNIVIKIPLADGNPDSRVYAYEIVVVGDEGAPKLHKAVYAAGCNMGIGHEPNGGVTTLEIPASELPPGKTLTFAVRPLTSLGTSGKAIATEFKV